MFSLKKTGLSTAAYPTPRDRFITIVWSEFQTRSTGIPGGEMLLITGAPGVAGGARGGARGGTLV